MNLASKLEAVLFAAAQAMTVKKLSDLTGEEKDAVQSALERLADRLNQEESGLQLIVHGEETELVTRPEVAELVRSAMKMEAEGELTRPSLEALAVLAYRGPLTRPELEQIRGVQSSMILRNLMIRGLVETKEDARLGQPVYQVTMDFLKHLGADRVESLQDYEKLRGNAIVEQVLNELAPAEKPPTSTVEV